jgi:hypothetical protein
MDPSRALLAEGSVEEAFWFFLRPNQKRRLRMITMMAAAATPTPIPAFAPAERPDDVDALPVEEDVDVDVDVRLAVEDVNSTVAELFTPASTLSVDCHLSSMGYA